MRKWLSRVDIEAKRNSFLDNIDPYCDYIEDGTQYRRACKLNERYSKLAKFCGDILINLEKVESELKVKGFEGKVEYCMGYFRTIINGVYRYKKVNITSPI